jgi:hypothetical protein
MIAPGADDGKGFDQRKNQAETQGNGAPSITNSSIQP